MTVCEKAERQLFKVRLNMFIENLTDCIGVEGDIPIGETTMMVGAQFP